MWAILSGAIFQARNRNPNPNFLVRISSGGVEAFHVKGWGPKSSVSTPKPTETKLFGWICRDLAGISRGRPKKLEKKKFGFNFCFLILPPSKCPNPGRNSTSRSRKRHAQYDWTTGVPDNGNFWRKFRAVPRLYPLRSLVCTWINKVGSGGAFRLPGGGAGIVSVVRGTFARSYSVSSNST